MEDTLNQQNYNTFWREHSELDWRSSTKYLAHRDLPALLEEHLLEHAEKQQFKILDYGCGDGKTLNFVRNYFIFKGLDVDLYGADANVQNLEVAQNCNPEGKFFHLINNKIPDELNSFDLIICNFVLLENRYDSMRTILKNIYDLLNDKGIASITGNTAKVYDLGNAWVSFDMEHPENDRTEYDPMYDKMKRRDEQEVKKSVIGLNGKRFTFNDFFYRNKTRKQAYSHTDLQLIATRKPLGKPEDGIPWKSELAIPPYRIDIVRKHPESLHTQQIMPPQSISL